MLPKQLLDHDPRASAALTSIRQAKLFCVKKMAIVKPTMSQALVIPVIPHVHWSLINCKHDLGVVWLYK